MLHWLLVITIMLIISKNDKLQIVSAHQLECLVQTLLIVALSQLGQLLVRPQTPAARSQRHAHASSQPTSSQQATATPATTAPPLPPPTTSGAASNTSPTSSIIAGAAAASKQTHWKQLELLQQQLAAIIVAN